MRFLENFWYAAGWSSEITAKPLARRLLERPVALFRTVSGKAAAFDDCCPHRMVPLSRGTVEGESLRCGYHGLRFDCAGTCVEVPGQVSIPPRDDPSMTDYLGEAVMITFNEDKLLIDDQQRNVDARPQQRMLDNAADSGVVLARRIVERLLAEESSRSAGTRAA